MSAFAVNGDIVINSVNNEKFLWTNLWMNLELEAFRSSSKAVPFESPGKQYKFNLSQSFSNGTFEF